MKKKQPMLEEPADAEFSFEGLIGKRIIANQANWLLTAPASNPAMIEMFRNRDNRRVRTPSRDLLWWSGEFAGKYLISAVQTLRITKDQKLEATLKSFVADLINSQSPDGYLGPFESSKRMTGSDPKGHSLWDLWGQYHCMLGLYLWYRWSGDNNTLNAWKRAADLLWDTFPGSGRQVSEAGAQAMNQALIHIFALLYQEIGEPQEPGEPNYLQMVRAIESDWTSPGSGNYLQSALDGKAFFEFPIGAPRWESLHDIQAIAELYFITGDNKYRQAFEHIWWSIVERDRHNTGGFSSCEEATGNPYDPSPIETCATIAWIALTVDMLRMTRDSRAADELEITTWNAVLGAQSDDGKWWTYNTPMGGVPIQGVVPNPHIHTCQNLLFVGQRRPAVYDLDFQARPGSPQLSCCAANGPRGLGAFSQWAVMVSNDGGIALNYYGPSTFIVSLPSSSGKKVKLVQETDYPRRGLIKLTLTTENAEGEKFVLRLRIPGWSKNTKVMVNNEPQEENNISPGTYLEIPRLWKPGDTITLILDMSLWVRKGGPPPQNSRRGGNTTGKVSIYVGPLLLAYDPRFDVYDIQQLPAINLDHPPQIIESESSSHELPKPYLLLQFRTAASGRPITLCDFASAGAMSGPYLSGLPITEKTWQFSRSDGTVIASPIRLMADGSIQGHSHPNEARWGLEGDTIVFFAQDGRASTRFTTVSIEEGKMKYKGQSLISEQQIIHILSEIDFASNPYISWLPSP